MTGARRWRAFVGSAVLVGVCGTGWFSLSAWPAFGAADSGCTMEEVAPFLEPGDAAIEGSAVQRRQGEPS